MTSPLAPETQKTKYGPKLLAGVAFALGLTVALVILFGHRGPVQMYRLRQEGLRLEQENVRLAAENDRLARTIDRLQHDPEFIQDLIRRELNFVKKNEIIFQLPPDGQPHTPGAAASGNAGAPPVNRPDNGQANESVKPHWFWDLLDGARKKVTGLTGYGAKG